MGFFPKKVLRKLYNHTSLKHAGGDVCISVKNRLSPGWTHGISRVAINGQYDSRAKVTIASSSVPSMQIGKTSPENPIDFSLGDMLTFSLGVEPMSGGEQTIEVDFQTLPFDQLQLKVSDSLNFGKHAPDSLPRDVEDDHCEEIVSEGTLVASYNRGMND